MICPRWLTCEIGQTRFSPQLSEWKCKHFQVTQSQKLVFRFPRCCWKLARWNIPPIPSSVAPGTLKTESMKARNWTIQLTDDQELREDKALCTKGYDFFFLLELIIWAEFQSCFNKHNAKETLIYPWCRFICCQHFVPFAKWEWYTCF